MQSLSVCGLSFSGAMNGLGLSHILFFLAYLLIELKHNFFFWCFQSVPSEK